MSDILRQYFEYPLENEKILQYRKKLYKELSRRENLLEKRIVVLSGSTVGCVKDVLGLFLLYNGIRPVFQEGAYNRFYEDALFDTDKIKAFQPDFVYIHTTGKNLEQGPAAGDDEEAVLHKLNGEYARFESVWEALFASVPCAVIQNNFEMPAARLLGNADIFSPAGQIHYIESLNHKLNAYARRHSNFYINDIHYVSAAYGLAKWHNNLHWHMYKYAMDVNAVPFLCQSIANIIKSVSGGNKKAVVVDLDNTLWGGVIGDEEAQHIEIGEETPKGEVYLAFQKYLLSLKSRGVLLAVCSKNDRHIARSGFDNPKMALKWEDFAVIKANWQDKASNITAIGKELNLSPDSFVFIDDNPAEREFVLSQIPGIAVNDANEAETFIDFIDKNGFFESAAVTAEDLRRGDYYRENAGRTAFAAAFADYDAYLESLGMDYAFDSFNETNRERVVQLINKTNQFNVTAKRMTDAQVRALMNEDHFNMAVSLKDRFGDNGLISVFSGKREREKLTIEIWLMSCRVLKRKVEYKLFDRVLAYCAANGIETIQGRYVPTAKNGMVAGFYDALGFRQNKEGLWIYNTNSQSK